MSDTVSITVFGSFADPRTRNAARDIDVAYWGCDLLDARAGVVQWAIQSGVSPHAIPPINCRKIDPVVDAIQAVEDYETTVCLRGQPYKRTVNKWSLPRAIRYVARHNEWPRDSGEFVVSLESAGDSYTGDGMDALDAAMLKLPDSVRNKLRGHPLFDADGFFDDSAFDFIRAKSPRGSPRLWYSPRMGSIRTDYQGDIFSLGLWQGAELYLGVNIGRTPGILFIDSVEIINEPKPTTSVSHTEESIMPAPVASSPITVETTPSPLSVLGSTMGEGAKDGASMAIAKTMVVAFMATSIGRKMPMIMRTDFAGEILAYILPVLTYLAASYMPSMVPHHEVVKAVSLRAIRGYTAIFVSEIMGQLRSFFLEVALQDLAEKKDA